jgi:hypothetical protein
VIIVGWTTLLVEGVGALALLFAVVFVLLFWSAIRNFRLGEPRVRGVRDGEAPRYLELATEPARRQFEELGFRRAGYLATKPMLEAEAEVVQLVMRNDETRTLAYLHVRTPFTEARPAAVGFESFLSDGSVLGTRQGFIPGIGRPLPNRRRSSATDDEGVYRDHLAALAQSGLEATELPATFEGLVALNVADAAWVWRRKLEDGSVVAWRGGGFRIARWASLAYIPRLLLGQVRGRIAEAQRRRSDQAPGPVVDAHLPEIRQFLDQRGRRTKEVAEAATKHFKMSRTRTAVLWVALVIGFMVFWQLLNRRLR